MSIQDWIRWVKTIITTHSTGGQALKVEADLSSVSSVNLAKETGGNLASIEDNVKSKINRIKGASNYNRAITYAAANGAPGGENPTVIVHTGTTELGSETVTETITYAAPLTDGSRVSNILYS